MDPFSGWRHDMSSLLLSHSGFAWGDTRLRPLALLLLRYKMVFSSSFFLSPVKSTFSRPPSPFISVSVRLFLHFVPVPPPPPQPHFVPFCFVDVIIFIFCSTSSVFLSLSPAHKGGERFCSLVCIVS